MEENALVAAYIELLVADAAVAMAGIGVVKACHREALQLVEQAAKGQPVKDVLVDAACSVLKADTQAVWFALYERTEEMCQKFLNKRPRRQPLKSARAFAA